MTTQHRRDDDVLSLTTSLVTPLNFVILCGCALGLLVVELVLLFDLAERTESSSGGWPLVMRLCMTPFPAPLTNDPLSEAVLVRDWARCFFRFASVVPECD